MTKLSDAAKQAIVRAYSAGVSPSVIAQRFGCHPKTPRLLARGRSSRAKPLDQKSRFLRLIPAEQKAAAETAWNEMLARFPDKPDAGEPAE